MNIEFLIEIFKSDTFWMALGSIGTFAMAFATWKILRQNQKEKKEIEDREIVEKIIVPIISNLNELEHKIKNLWQYINHGRG